MSFVNCDVYKSKYRNSIADFVSHDRISHRCHFVDVDKKVLPGELLFFFVKIPFVAVPLSLSGISIGFIIFSSTVFT